MSKLYFIVLLLFIFSLPDVHAENQKKQEDPVYKNLFKNKKTLRSHHGLITVHQYENKLYFEMPIEMFQREFLLRTVISRSNNTSFSGLISAPQRYITMQCVDSMILYKERIHNLVFNTEDSVQQHAMKLSKGRSILRVFPVKGYTQDSLRVIYDVTDFYKPTNKEIVNLKGLPYNSSLITVSGFSANPQTSYLNKVCVYDSSIMVNNTLTGTLDVSFLGLYKLDSNPKITLEYSTYLVLLPQQKMTPRITNPNVGTGSVPFYDYRPIVDVKWKNYVTRYRLRKGEPLIFYIDTLIPTTWQAAIRKAAAEWNKVFQRNKLGTPLTIHPYPATDSSFSFEDPLKNIIYLTNSTAETMKSKNVVDPRTGEIISSHISVSRDAANAIRRVGIMQLAAVDERFRSYFIPDDAVCEGLHGIALRTFGYALGLTANYAGSYAYSPEQIRSAAFTRENGFTASVMDNILYNTLAQPGDKEKGVRLVIDRVGPADELALRYLYDTFGPAETEEEELKAFVRKHEGDPRYLCIGGYSNVPSDPRGQAEDLGNDPLAYHQLRTANMKYLVRECSNWFGQDDVPDNFKRSLPDVVMSEYLGAIVSPLYAYIGGMYVNEANQISSLPPYTVVNRELQKKVTHTILTASNNIDWLNNRPFLYLGGANTSMSEHISQQGIPITPLIQRLKYHSFYVTKAGQNPYTHQEYVTDIESYLFSDIASGKPLSTEKINLLRAYLSGLIALSPSLTEIDKLNRSGGDKSIKWTDNLSLSFDELTSNPALQRLIWQRQVDNAALQRMQAISFFSLDDQTSLVFETLGRIGKILEKSKTYSNDNIYKRKMDYYLSIIRRFQKPSKT